MGKDFTLKYINETFSAEKVSFCDLLDYSVKLLELANKDQLS